MRGRISTVVVVAVSLAVACGYDPHPKGGGGGSDGGGGVSGNVDGSIVDSSSAVLEAGARDLGTTGETGLGTGIDGSVASGDGAVGPMGVEAGGEAAPSLDSALDKPVDAPAVTIDGGKDANSSVDSGSGGTGGSGGVVSTGGINGTGGTSAPDAPVAAGGTGGAVGTTGTGGSPDSDAPLTTGGTGGIIATGGTVATGGVVGTGGDVGTGGLTTTGGIIGTGGTVGTGGAGTGGTTTSCTNTCTAGATQCQSGATLQTCTTGGNGCTSFANSTCSTGLVCERYAPADCLDPNWAEWPMPNSQADVTAGAPNLESYTDNGDGTVADNVTGLMWQQVVPTTTYTWTNAIAYCPSLTLGGHSDWRLPKRVELVSIVDLGKDSPAIDTAYFIATPTSRAFWSSSQTAGGTAYAWQVDFNFGLVQNSSVQDGCYVRCVR